MMLKLILLFELMAAAMLAQSPSDYLWTGQGWREWPMGTRIGYVMGFDHGYFHGGMAMRSGASDQQFDKAKKIGICMDEMKSGQMVAIMDKFIAEHPEKRNRSVGELFLEAMGKACAGEH